MLESAGAIKRRSTCHTLIVCGNKERAPRACLVCQQAHHARCRRIIQTERWLIKQQDGWPLRCSEDECESATLAIGAARCRTVHQICNAKISGECSGARHFARRKHLRQRSRTEQKAWVLRHVTDHMFGNVSLTTIKWEQACSEREEC
jgi:hypothetical protein